jgi:hypothetical protein
MRFFDWLETVVSLLSMDGINTWGDFPVLRNLDFEVIFISKEAQMF